MKNTVSPTEAITIVSTDLLLH
jgi:hypothetical protein